MVVIILLNFKPKRFEYRKISELSLPCQPLAKRGGVTRKQPLSQTKKYNKWIFLFS